MPVGAAAAIAFGLISAVTWGIGDFSGGLASRKLTSSMVVFWGQVVGIVFLAGLAVLWREPLPGARDVMWGALAGLAGGIGLVSLYRAMAIGQMAIASPVASLISTAIPVLYGFVWQGLPAPVTLVGFGLALAGVALVSQPSQHATSADRTTRSAGLRLAIISGVGFALFFILIAQKSQGLVYWPLVAARLSSMTLIMAVAAFRREVSGPRNAIALVIGSGIMDALGNAFFVLSAGAGRLDIATTLSSLYPASTVFLSIVLLKERMNRVQAIGVALTLFAVPLIAMQSAV